MRNFNQKGLSPIIIVLIVLIVVILAGLGGWLVYKARQPKPPLEIPEIKVEKPVEAPFNLTTTKLATIPEEYDWVRIPSITFSPDGRQVTYVAGKDEKEFMVINGKEGKSYDFVWLHDFSPDGKQIAYRAWEVDPIVFRSPLDLSREEYQKQRTQAIKEGREFVVINGTESQAYDISGNIPIFKDKKERASYDQPHTEPILFSPDGKQIAYRVKNGGEKFLMIDGKKEKIYGDASEYGIPVFSPDSKKIAYLDCEVKDKEQWPTSHCFVVINGERGKSYDLIDVEAFPFSGLVFSPDSQKVAYVAGEIGKEGEWEFKKFVVINDKEGKSYDWDDMISFLTFSPDSQQIAYLVEKKEKMFVVINEKEGEAYDEIYPSYFIDIPEKRFITFFSPDGKRFAYWARKGEKEYIVIDGKEIKIDGEVFGLSFSPDGKQIIYVVIRGGKEHIVINGKESRGYDEILGVTFSRDSKQIGYAVREGEKQFVVINDKEGKAYDEVKSPVFSPDGKQVAYRAREGKNEFVVINTKEGRKFEKVFGAVIWEAGVYYPVYPGEEKVTDLLFTPDGSSIGYGAKLGNELWWIVDEIEEFSK